MIVSLVCSALTFTFGARSVSLDPVTLKTREGMSASVRYERVAEDVLRVHVTGPTGCLDEAALSAVGPLKALWYGNGHCVLQPGPVSLESNGHANATSYDAFEFENGVSVLMASEEPIKELFHRPDASRCGISAADPTVFTVVAGTNGAAACAIRYRKLYPKRPAPGVSVKAGKMCLDLWNGTLKDQTALLKRLKAEGIGDDFFLLTHNWQRFGYDAGLPDVFPPNPKFGTAADLRELLETARGVGWYAGVHLNTIDMYPKAPSWDKTWICRDEKGEIVPAWYNAFAEDQSYRVLPERQSESVRRQLKSMNDGGCPSTAVFVDVNGSLSEAVNPYWDAAGRRHTRSECVRHYGAMFDAIRETQDPATGVRTFANSEACHDFLAGHLDGGDCQWLEPDHAYGEYVWYPLGAYESLVKVPWFDLVNHRAISLHGVGYSIRYESGRGALFHGIDSDDYLSAEILAGHPLMVDCYTRDVKNVSSGTLVRLDLDVCARQVMRHYRLAQRTVAELAEAEIEDFRFADGNRSRQCVVWSNGTIVWVNRGKGDWEVRPGVVLPRYGYFATNRVTGTTSAIRRERGRVIEESAHVADGRLVRYRDNRDRAIAGILPLVPTAVASVKNGRVVGRVELENYRNMAYEKKPVTASVWLVRRKKTENSRKLPDYRLIDVSVLLGESFDFDAALPSEAEGVYDLLVSFVSVGTDPAEETKRLRTLGTDSFYTRFHLGRITVGGGFVPYVQPDRDLYDRALGLSCEVSVPAEPGALARAVREVRAFRQANPDHPATLVLEPGPHILSESLSLGAADSGSPGAPVVWRGTEGAVIRGGVDVGPWTDCGGGVVSAPIPTDAAGKPLVLDMLFVNGTRASRSVLPKNRASFKVPGGAQDSWREIVSTNADGTVRYAKEFTRLFADGAAVLDAVPPEELGEVQMQVRLDWSQARRRVAGWNGKDRLVFTEMFGGPAPWRQWGERALIRFENVRAGFSDPGDWFYDARNGKVLYRLRAGECVKKLTASAPAGRLSKLLEARSLHDVRFENLSFELADSPQAVGDDPVAHVQIMHGQSARTSDAAVTLAFCRDVVFSRCRVARTGNYGFRIGTGCRQVTLSRCETDDTGAGGVWMGSDKIYPKPPQLGRRVIRELYPESCVSNVISDCTFRRGGRFHPEGTAVFVTHASDNLITHNAIDDFFYSGITLGYTWGYGGSPSQRNEVSFNRISHIGQGEMFDLSGIYTLAASYGTVISNNVVAFVGGQGIYMDEGSEGVLIENNLVTHIEEAAAFMHFGAGCTFRNNIFAYNEKHGLAWASKKEAFSVPSSIDFLCNVFLTEQAPLMGPRTLGVAGVRAHNVWWKPGMDGKGSVKSEEFDGLTAVEYLAKGRAYGDVVADPLFVDAKNGDFRLKPDSPALKLGFREWDASLAGPRPEKGLDKEEKE